MNAVEIIPGAAPVSAPVVAAPIAIRINAGSDKAWTDTATGNIWAADAYFIGGGAFSNCPISIDGTTLDTLFCSERYFSEQKGAYIIPVQPGIYTVKMMFAETFFWGAGQRVFKLSVQGKVPRLIFFFAP